MIVGDTDFLNWIEEHLSSLRYTVRDEDNNPYDMFWIDANGESHITRGANIRNCILNALANIETEKA